MGGLILSALLTALFDILVSFVIRWLVRAIHIEGFHERLLRWLEERRFRRPMDAFTTKEIIEHGVVRSVDSAVVSEEAKQRIVEGLGRWGLVKKRRDFVLGTPMTFEWKKFFIYLAPILDELVVPKLVELYKQENVACFAVLPYPRRKKSRLTADFERSLENRLGSREIFKDFFSPAIIERKISTQWVHKIIEGEKILILQPMAMNDDYLEKAIKCVRDYSVGSIIEILTLVDASSRPVGKRSIDPPERVLIDINLNVL
jgi:hypothetical protein